MQQSVAKLIRLRLIFLALLGILLSSSHLVADEELIDWLPVDCRALNTVGLHDAVEEEGALKEEYEPASFFPSEFRLEENMTFSELLSEEDGKVYISMQIQEMNAQFEFTCTVVRGRSEEDGYVCTNTPAQDILMINPNNGRFTRAAVGAWTFFHTSDLETGASLLVEHGTCIHLDVETDQPDEEE